MISEKTEDYPFDITKLTMCMENSMYSWFILDSEWSGECILSTLRI